MLKSIHNTVLRFEILLLTMFDVILSLYVNYNFFKKFLDLKYYIFLLPIYIGLDFLLITLYGQIGNRGYCLRASI